MLQEIVRNWEGYYTTVHVRRSSTNCTLVIIGIPSFLENKNLELLKLRSNELQFLKFSSFTPYNSNPTTPHTSIHQTSRCKYSSTQEIYSSHQIFFTQKIFLTKYFCIQKIFPPLKVFPVVLFHHRFHILVTSQFQRRGTNAQPPPKTWEKNITLKEISSIFIQIGLNSFW